MRIAGKLQLNRSIRFLSLLSILLGVILVAGISFLPTVRAFPSTVSMTLSYTIVGGGSPTAPVFNYYQGGNPETSTLTLTPTPISVDSGSSWSVTPNPLTGLTSSEQWTSNQALSGTASASTIVFTFYHQFLQTLSYGLAGSPPGSPTAPSFTANQFGLPTSKVLTGTPTAYWFDDGASWSVTNPLGGSTSSEQWATSPPLSGTISPSQTTYVFTYYHQYYLTMEVAPFSNFGTVSPGSTWRTQVRRSLSRNSSERRHLLFSLFGWVQDQAAIVVVIILQQ